MKLHLPKLLLTALLAAVAMAPAAWGATYSVTMGTVSDGSYYIHDCTFTDDSTGTAASGYAAVAVASNGSGSEHILHFTSSTGTVEDAALIVQYNDFGIAGVDVDADTNVAKIGYTGTRSFYIGRKGVTSASTVDRDFTFEASGSINLHGTQTWTVAAEKTFTFIGSSIINNGDITINGDGGVDFSSKSVSGTGSIAVNGTLKNATFASGSTIELNSGATLENVTLSDGSYVATTYEWGKTSGKHTVTKTWDAGTSTGFTAGTSVGLNIGGLKLAGTSSYENSTLTISTNVYNIAAADTVSVADISGVSNIIVNGTLTGAADATLSTSTPVVGSGTVQVNGMLEDDLDALAGFTGIVELVDGGKIHFGNNNSKLSNINKIKINSGAYITGWRNDSAQFAHDIQLNGGALMVNGGTWNGDIHVAEDSSIEVYNGSTIKGNLTAANGKTLAITKPIIYTSDTNYSSDPTLIIEAISENNNQGGYTNASCGKLDGATLDIQHGTVKIQGRYAGNSVIAGAIKVGAGATLQVAGADTLGYTGGNYTDSITAEGTAGKLAKIKFDNTQTLSNDLILKGYAEVSGEYFSGFGGKVTVNNTNNTIKNEYKMRKAITFEVNGSLTMEGAITNFDDSGMLTKTGTGDMTITGNITTNHGIKISNGTLNINGTSNTISANVQAEAGELNISGNTAISSNLTVTAGGINYKAGTHSVGTLDLANGQKATGSVTLKKNETAGKQVVLTASTLWLRKAATLSIEEGATLKLGNNGIVNIKGTAGSTTSAVSSSNTGGGAKYLITGTDGNGGDAEAYTISNAEVSVDTSSAAQTISNILSNSKLINNGSYKLVSDNTASTYSAIDATKGSIDILNAQEQTLSALTVGAGMAVGVYSGNSVPTKPTTADEATITVASLTAGTGATLNANLVLSSGATVTMATALTMGSTLMLSSGMTLDGTMLTSVTGLREGETVDLFKSVDSLILGDATYDADNALAEGTVSLHQYFTNVTNESIYLAFNNGNVFAGIMSIPEPTTATLSLLALAGLAARRRRASR